MRWDRSEEKLKDKLRWQARIHHYLQLHNEVCQSSGSESYKHLLSPIMCEGQESGSNSIASSGSRYLRRWQLSHQLVTLI